MCFSATVSFSAGALLLGLGTLTLKSSRRPRELPFAAIPWFILVWCFFAAILSGTVFFHLVWRRDERSAPRFQ